MRELTHDILPPGVLNVITGPGGEIGKALASNKRIAKIAFTGETVTGRLIMQYASDPIIPQTLELGGKSPNIFFADVMDHDDDFLDKALEGFALYCFNKGEVCTCPSRALVQESIYDKFMERAVARVRKIKVGNPLDPATMMGPQVSEDQMNKILNYMRIGKEEGAKCLTGGARADLPGDLAKGYFLQPTVFSGHNKMRIFQEEIFGPVLSVTKFKNTRRSHRHRQRHGLRPGRRRVVAQHQQLLPRGPRDQSRPLLDQLLPRVSGRRRLRRLQGIRFRPRNPQADAGSLSTDQERAGEL